MNALEIIVIVAAVVIVLSVIIWSRVRRAHGKTACGCDCSACKHNCKKLDGGDKISKDSK